MREKDYIVGSIFLAILAVLLFIIEIISNTDKEGLLIFSSLTFCSSVLFIILKDILIKKFTILDVKYYTLMGFFLFIGLGSLQSILSGVYKYYSYELIYDALLLSMFSLISFIVGCNIVIKNNVIRSFRFPINTYSDKFLVLFYLVIATISITGLYYRASIYGGILEFATSAYYTKHFGGFIENVLKFFGRLYIPAVVISAYFLFSKVYGIKIKLVSIFLLLIILLFCTIQGARGYIILFCLLTINSIYAFHDISSKKVLFLCVIPLLIISSVLFMAQSLYRNDPLLIINSNIVNNEINLKHEILSNCNSFPHFLEIINQFPENYSFTYGKSLFNIATNFIPRSIWPEKPVGFGSFLAVDVYGGSVGVSFGGTLVGEAYANGSILGIIIISFALGVIAKLCYLMYLKNSQDVISTTFYITTMWHFFNIVRGDFLSAVFPLIGNLMTMFIVLICCKIIYRNLFLKNPS